MLAGGNPPNDWPMLLAVAQEGSTVQRLDHAMFSDPGRILAKPGTTTLRSWRRTVQRIAEPLRMGLALTFSNRSENS